MSVANAKKYSQMNFYVGNRNWKYSSLDLWLERRCCPNKILKWNWKKSESFNATSLNHDPWWKKNPTASYENSNAFRLTDRLHLNWAFFPASSSLCSKNSVVFGVCARFALTHGLRIALESIVLCACKAAAVTNRKCVYEFVCSIFLSFRPCDGMRFESRSSCISSRQPNVASHIQSSNIWIAYSSTSHCLESDFFTIFQPSLVLKSP